MPKIGQTVGDATVRPEKATCAPRTPAPRTKQPQRPEARTERARLAYLAGDAARDSHCITAQAHHLYEILIRYAGCRSFSWVGVKRLAEDLGKSERCIDRLIKELGEDGAGLIRRERRVGTTSYTFITAFERLEQQVEDRSADELIEAAAEASADGQGVQAAALLHQAAERMAAQGEAPSAATPTPCADAGLGVGGACAAEGDQPDLHTTSNEEEATDNLMFSINDYRASIEPGGTFFCASQSDKNGGSVTPKMADLTTMKNRSLNVKEESTSPQPPASLPTRRARGGGGGRFWRDEGSEPVLIQNAITERLRAEGVIDIRTLNELADRPLSQVESAARIVRALRAPNDPRRPGLLVKILRLQAHGRDRAADEGQGAPAAEQPSGAAPSSEQEHAPAAEVQAERTEPSMADLAAWATLWQAVQAQLAATLDPQAYGTWIAATALVELSEDEAVIATPNVFVRDEIEERYYEQISAALAEALGRRVAVALFINPAADALRALR